MKKTKYLIRYRWENSEIRFFETQIECEDSKLPNELFDLMKTGKGMIIQKIVRNG